MLQQTQIGARHFHTCHIAQVSNTCICLTEGASAPEFLLRFSGGFVPDSCSVASLHALLCAKLVLLCMVPAMPSMPLLLEPLDCLHQRLCLAARQVGLAGGDNRPSHAVPRTGDLQESEGVVRNHPPTTRRNLPHRLASHCLGPQGRPG